MNFSDLSELERMSLAINEKTAPDVLAKLSHDANWDCRAQVAENASTPVEALVRLADDEIPFVRARLASNPQMPVYLLIELANDTESSVRSSVARHPNCPIEQLESLAKDDAWCVKENVAGNRNTPAELLYLIADYRNTDMSTFDDRQKWGLIDAVSEVAANPNCPMNLLVTLSEHSNGEVRGRVAKHIPSSHERFISMTVDGDFYVRSCAAENKDCSIEILVMLLNDTEEMVRIRAKENLSGKSGEDFEKAACDGLFLSTPVCNSQDKTVGNVLLDAGLTDAYQAIQAAEISRMVTQATSGSAESAVSGKTMASIAGNLRM